MITVSNGHSLGFLSSRIITFYEDVCARWGRWHLPLWLVSTYIHVCLCRRKAMVSTYNADLMGSVGGIHLWHINKNTRVSCNSVSHFSDLSTIHVVACTHADVRVKHVCSRVCTLVDIIYLWWGSSICLHLKNLCSNIETMGQSPWKTNNEWILLSIVCESKVWCILFLCTAELHCVPKMSTVKLILRGCKNHWCIIANAPKSTSENSAQQIMHYSLLCTSLVKHYSTHILM